MIIELNDKSDLPYDELMQTPDTPAVARLRATREVSMWWAIGERSARKAA